MKLNSHQFSMFEPAGKLADTSVTAHGDDYDGEGVMDYKLDESNIIGSSDNSHDAKRGQEAGYARMSGPSLVESIHEEGVRDPVMMYPPEADRMRSFQSNKPMIGDGHHRVAAANYIDPQMEVPVKWVGGGR